MGWRRVEPPYITQLAMDNVSSSTAPFMIYCRRCPLTEIRNGQASSSNSCLPITPQCINPHTILHMSSCLDRNHGYQWISCWGQLTRRPSRNPEDWVTQHQQRLSAVCLSARSRLEAAAVPDINPRLPPYCLQGHWCTDVPFLSQTTPLVVYCTVYCRYV